MTPKEREAAANVLKALAHPVRMGAVELLADGEKTVTELQAELACSQSVMSSQLRILREQGLIRTRRDGAFKYCSLRNRDFLKMIQCLKSHIHCALKIDQT